MTFGRGAFPAALDVTLWAPLPNAIGLDMIRGRTTQQAASATWPTAGQAIGIPIRVKRPLTIYQLGWGNGATVTGNMDVGLYDAAGNKLVSTGSTAQAGASVMQRVDVTDTVIPMGLVYLVAVNSLSTSTVFRWAPPIAQLQSVWGCVTVAATAIPLASTVTFTRTDTLLFVPLVFAQGKSLL